METKAQIARKRLKRQRERNAKHQREFLARKAKMGQVKVIVWVMPDQVAKVKAFAESLQLGAGEQIDSKIAMLCLVALRQSPVVGLDPQYRP